jgi:hypothetical protein
MILHHLLVLRHHVIPLLLLIRVKNGPYLRVAALAHVHHFPVPVLRRHRTVLARGFHLRPLGFKNALYFGLLIGGEVELFG